jgi:hypothetical protein
LELGLGFESEGSDWPDQINLQLDWNQVSDIMLAVKKKGGLLRPSLHWCRRHLGWWPGIVVADMGYLSAPGKQVARAGWQCAVVTKLRADMKLVPPYINAARAECPQGQRLEWWEYEPESGQQWFRVPAEPELCAHCWDISAQHWPLYLAEFEHRHNCRKISDGERTDVGLQKAAGKRLIYKSV